MLEEKGVGAKLTLRCSFFRSSGDGPGGAILGVADSPGKCLFLVPAAPKSAPVPYAALLFDAITYVPPGKKFQSLYMAKDGDASLTGKLKKGLPEFEKSWKRKTKV